MSNNYDFDKFGTNEQLRAAVIKDLVSSRTRLTKDIFGIAFVTNYKQTFVQRNFRNPFMGIRVMEKAYRKYPIDGAYLGQISFDVPIIADEVNYQIPEIKAQEEDAAKNCEVPCEEVPDEAAV